MNAKGWMVETKKVRRALLCLIDKWKAEGREKEAAELTEALICAIWDEEFVPQTTVQTDSSDRYYFIRNKCNG